MSSPSVCHSSEPCKSGWTDRDAVRVVGWDGPRNHVLEGQFSGKRGAHCKVETFCRELCENGWIDRDAAWITDSVSRVGPRKHVLDGGCRSPCEGAIVRVQDMSGHAWRHPAVSYAQTTEPIEMPFWLWARVDSSNHALDGVHISLCEWENFRRKDMPGLTCPRRHSADCRNLCKMAELIEMHLGCGLAWDEGSMCYMGGYIGATWRIWLNRPWAAAMRSSVKLLWPPVWYWTVIISAL